MSPEMRIADADRDAAVSALGEHYAAGRLTREEFDERSDRAMSAKTASGLSPLFADLPAPWPPATGRRSTGPGAGRTSGSTDPARGAWGAGRRSRGVSGRGVALLPLIVLAVVVSVFVLRAPWLLFVIGGFLWCSGGLYRRS
ncbi:MAG: hypothetical protein AVDCRST_MAG72-2542 [uncultured Nocardioidaceae bacterium]|uniref:DUF1707 domain-containing protein n=1 Tax=uncultured Nocardioidaceae bacterium TaxID=253824 RepID=A0A6J4MN56_9ACTN|nr:MAG: hypothetical protein AVDCRST_MAG72-2542 [uncultured Nocardioidaceae bacterium]